MSDDDTDPAGKEAGWWIRHSNMVTLTRWMADNGYDADQVAYAVEKPWKHTAEFMKASSPIKAVDGG
jgi:hypothetical protein